MIIILEIGAGLYVCQVLIAAALLMADKGLHRPPPTWRRLAGWGLAVVLLPLLLLVQAADKPRYTK